MEEGTELLRHDGIDKAVQHGAVGGGGAVVGRKHPPFDGGEKQFSDLTGRLVARQPRPVVVGLANNLRQPVFLLGKEAAHLLPDRLRERFVVGCEHAAKMATYPSTYRSSRSRRVSSSSQMVARVLAFARR